MHASYHGPSRRVIIISVRAVGWLGMDTTHPCLHIMLTMLAMLVLLPTHVPIAAAFAGGQSSSSLHRHSFSAPASSTSSTTAATSTTVLHAEKTACLGMGCFWKPSETMLSVPGVTSTMAGYSGKADATKPPLYSDVCASRDFVEAVRVTFDDEQITYPELLDAYFESQEAKPGYRQYAPIIFACGEEQMAESQAWLTKAREEGRVGNGGIPALAIAVEPATKFYKAENYHQTFWQKNRPRFAFGVVLLAVSSGALNSIIPSADIARSVETGANYVFLIGAVAMQAERWLDKDVVEVPV